MGELPPGATKVRTVAGQMSSRLEVAQSEKKGLAGCSLKNEKDLSKEGVERMVYTRTWSEGRTC